MNDYINKMKGGGKRPPGVAFVEIWWSWIGSFSGIALCAYITSFYLDERDLTLVIGSFGATAVLLYAAIKSPLAQPRNLLGGHIFSAIIGVTCYKLFGDAAISSALAVSISIAFMLMTETLHPPGGATALIAVIGSSKIHNLGYFYVLIPVALGAVILLVVALLVNNIAGKRRYPEFWF